jgi:hypothetical protein
MSERENNVYKAKLAEQAERYDGELTFCPKLLYFNVKIGKFKAATLKKNFFLQWLPKARMKKSKSRKSTKNRSNATKKRSGLLKKFVLSRKGLIGVADVDGRAVRM